MMANPALRRAHERLKKQSERQRKVAQDVALLLAQQAARQPRPEATT